MSVEIYDYPGGEKFERVIARHARPQARIKAEAAKIEARAKAKLNRIQARERAEWKRQIAEADSDEAKADLAAQYRQWEREKTTIYRSHGKIDEHVGLDKPGGRAVYVEASKRILRDSL